MRAFLTFAGAWLVTTPVVALLAEEGTPFWTAFVAGMGAAFLAAAVVAMEEGVVEDALKGVIFAFLGGALLAFEIPGWVAWPLIVGPWAGFVGNRRGAGPTVAEGPAETADGADRAD